MNLRDFENMKRARSARKPKRFRTPTGPQNGWLNLSGARVWWLI